MPSRVEQREVKRAFEELRPKEASKIKQGKLLKLPSLIYTLDLNVFEVRSLVQVWTKRPSG